MSARYTVGELVDVVIKGARVTSVESRFVEVAYEPYNAAEPVLVTVRPAVGVSMERVAPAEWPPQIDDVWTDPDGNAWFAVAPTQRASDNAWMVCGAKHGQADHANNVIRQYGPMTLVYRKGWTPTPAADVDQADAPKPHREGRAAIADGLRQLADLVERTGVPVPSVLAVGQDTHWMYDESGWRQPSDEEAIGRVQAWADALGVEHQVREVADSGVHHNIAGRLAGVAVELSCIVKAPAEPATVDSLPAAPDITGGGEVAGPSLAGPGPATAPARSFDLGAHGHHVGQVGGPGENGAECICGVGYWGFDTYREAAALLDKHIANPDPRDQVDPFRMLPDVASDNGVNSEAAVESDPAALDQLGVAATDPGELAALMPELPPCPPHGPHPHGGMRCLDCRICTGEPLPAPDGEV